MQYNDFFYHGKIMSLHQFNFRNFVFLYLIFINFYRPSFIFYIKEI